MKKVISRLNERREEFENGACCGESLAEALRSTLLCKLDDHDIFLAVAALGRAVDERELEIQNLKAGTRGKSFDELFAMGK